MSRRTNSQTYLRNRTPDGRYASALSVIRAQQAHHQETELARERTLILELEALSPEKLAWYEDDTNVPPYGPTADRLAILERLIEEAKCETLSSTTFVSRIP